MGSDVGTTMTEPCGAIAIRIFCCNSRAHNRSIWDFLGQNPKTPGPTSGVIEKIRCLLSVSPYIQSSVSPLVEYNTVSVEVPCNILFSNVSERARDWKCFSWGLESIEYPQG